MMTNSDDRKFIETLQPGDKVFIYTTGGCTHIGDGLLLKTVKRITKSHIIIDVKGTESKFRKDTLEEAGRKFGRMYMGDPHDEIVEYNAFYIAKYERQHKESTCKRIIKFLNEKKLQELSDIWAWLKQCETNAKKEDLLPLLVFRRNRSDPIAAMPWDTFLCVWNEVLALREKVEQLERDL
jgi:hypothetical protein